MSMISTRSATLNDLETLLRFEQGVIAAERPYDPTLKDDPINYYDLKALITSEDAQIIVAELNGELVGSGYALIKPSRLFEKHGRYAYLGFMFVPEASRGLGINKKIIEALKVWAISKGLTEIRLEVYMENESAIKAYNKAGFKAHLLEMRLDVNDHSI